MTYMYVVCGCEPSPRRAKHRVSRRECARASRGGQLTRTLAHRLEMMPPEAAQGAGSADAGDAAAASAGDDDSGGNFGDDADELFDL